MPWRAVSAPPFLSRRRPIAAESIARAGNFRRLNQARNPTFRAVPRVVRSVP